MSTLSVTTLKSKTALTPPVVQDLNGVGIGTFCRAWVNFNGTGTVAIRAAFNVSSITDNGVGDYTVNFTNAMPDANYCIAGTGVNITTDARRATVLAISASSYRLLTENNAGSSTDATYVLSSVFR